MSSGLFIRAIRLPKHETALSEPDVRFEAHCGLNSDIARGPKSANSRHSPRPLTLNQGAPLSAARLPTWQNPSLGETVKEMQGLKRGGPDRVGTFSPSIAVLQ